MFFRFSLVLIQIQNWLSSILDNRESWLSGVLGTNE